MKTDLKNWLNVVNAVSEWKATSNPHKRKAESKRVQQLQRWYQAEEEDTEEAESWLGWN